MRLARISLGLRYVQIHKKVHYLLLAARDLGLRYAKMCKKTPNYALF